MTIDNNLKEYELVFANPSTDQLSKIEIGKKLCSAYYLTKDYPRCIQYGLETLELSEKFPNNQVQLELLTTLCDSFYITGDFHQERELRVKRQAVLISNQGDSSQIGKSYHDLGACDINLGDYQRAIKNLIQAYDLYEESHKEKISVTEEELALLYLNIGTIYQITKQPNQAIEWYTKAMHINKSSNDSRILVNLGCVYQEMGQLTKALAFYRKALKHLAAKDYNTIKTSCFLNMSLIYIGQKRYQKALSFLLQLYQFTDQSEILPPLQKVTSLLGYIYTRMGDYPKAKKFFQKSLKLDKKVKLHRLSTELYHDYSLYCFKTGNPKKAYQYLQKSYQLNQTIYNEELLQNTTYLTAQFEMEQKKNELEIYRLKNIELVKSQQTIEQKNEELMKTSETKDNLLGMLSHDLKNYIGATLTAQELFLLKAKEFIHNKYLNMANESSQKALTLVKDILLMNKMEVDGLAVQLSQHNINDVISALLENLVLLAKRKDIQIIISFTTDPLCCLLNIDKFQRAIDNLVINAIKFTPRMGSIWLTTKQIDDQAGIFLKDSGIGMNQVIRANLFQQYSRAGRKGTDGEESTGLGLYIVKTILEKHSASIEVFSEEGKGSEFVIKIPLIRK